MESFDLDRITSLNALQMADAYVSAFFEDQVAIDKEARAKALEPLIGAVVAIEDAEKYLTKMGVEN